MRNDDFEKRSGNNEEVGGAVNQEVQIDVDVKEKEINADGGNEDFEK